MNINPILIILISLLCQSDQELAKGKAVVNNFYDKLLSNYKKHISNGGKFCCWPAIEYQSDHYYLDTSYFSFLRGQGVSETFINNEKSLVKDCNKQISDLKYIEDIVDIPECNFKNSYRWLGGQGELLDSFKIMSFKNMDKYYEGVIWIYSGEKPFSKNRIYIDRKPSGEYKIDSIQLYF